MNINSLFTIILLISAFFMSLVILEAIIFSFLKSKKVEIREENRP